MATAKILAAAMLLVAGAASAAPQARWLETKHNFGAFHEDDGNVECRMGYVNDGDSALMITAARSSCGCTLASYSRDEVAPGDTAWVVVSYDPTGRPGRFSKNVYIDMNTEPSRTTLTITGVVIGAPTTVGQRYPVEISSDMRLSRGAVMAGEVKAGHTKSVFVEAYNASTDTLRPVTVSTPSFVDVAWLPAAIAPGEQSSLVCHVKASASGQWGLVADSIMFSPSGLPGDVRALPVTVVVSEDFSRLSDEQRAKAPAITTDTDRIDFGTLDRGQGIATGTATIRNSGKSPLLLRRVYSLDNGVTATAERTRLKPGQSTRITVSVDPQAAGGNMLNSRISIVSNDPSRPNLTLRAVGIVK